MNGPGTDHHKTRTTSNDQFKLVPAGVRPSKEALSSAGAHLEAVGERVLGRRSEGRAV